MHSVKQKMIISTVLNITYFEKELDKLRDSAFLYFLRDF